MLNVTLLYQRNKSVQLDIAIRNHDTTP